MMVRKSRVEILKCCGGGAEELDAAASIEAVLGAGVIRATVG